MISRIWLYLYSIFYCALALAILIHSLGTLSREELSGLIVVTGFFVISFKTAIVFRQGGYDVALFHPFCVLTALLFGEKGGIPALLASMICTRQFGHVAFELKQRNLKTAAYNLLMAFYDVLRMIPVIAAGAWVYRQSGGTAELFSGTSMIAFCKGSLAIVLLNEITMNTLSTLDEGKPPWKWVMNPMDFFDVPFIPIALGIFAAYRHYGAAGAAVAFLPVGGLMLLAKRFFQEVAKRQETIQLLNVTNELISSTVDFSEMTSRIAKRFQEIMEVDLVEIFISEGGSWFPAFLTQSSPWKKGNPSPDFLRRMETIVEGGAPFLEMNVLGDFSPYEAAGMRVLLFIPLRSEDMRGCILCGHLRRFTYYDEEMELARLLMGQLTSALQGAKLHQELAITLKELQATQIQLVQSEKMAGLGKLVAGVAHELNNPLNFISMQLPLLETRFREMQELNQAFDAYLPSLPGEDQKLIGELEKSLEFAEMPRFFAKSFSSLKEGTNRCKRIIENLRTFARTETVGESWDFVDLNEAIDSTLILLTDRHENRIALHKAYGDIPKVWCNAPQMNQVFMNLLANAFDAIPGEGEVWIKTEIQDGRCVISFRDSGHGIPDDIKAKIFDPFFTTKEVGKGTGLGLSIVYTIIQQHKGEIKVDSALGKGTTFTIVLPLKNEHPSQ